MSRRPGLQKLFSAFPDGWPGAGLFLLRLAIALSAVAQGICVFKTPLGIVPWILGILTLLLVASLLIGFLTPIMASAATIGYLSMGAFSFLATDMNKLCHIFNSLDLAAISFALILLGPGAFSLDARLFGRREIIIPENRHPRY